MMCFLNLVLRDSPCESPFVPNKACEGSSGWIGPAVSATAQTIGDIIGYVENIDANNQNWDIAQLNAKMQRETNAKNYEIAQLANATNRANLREQNAFNERMWERQQAYNSPSHMVQLYKQAGLNPYGLVGSAGQVAQAGELRSGEPKAAERAQMVAPQLNYQKRPYDWSGAAANVINAYNASKLADAQSRKDYATSANTEISTEKERKAMSDYLQKLHNEAQGEGWKANLARQEFNYLESVNGIRQQLVQGDFMIQAKNLQMLDKQYESIQLDNTLKQIEILYRPKLNDKELQRYDATMAEISAQIGLINANQMLTNEQRLHEIEKKCGTIIDNRLKGFDEYVKRGTVDYIIKDQKNRSEILDFQRRNQKSGERLRRLTSVIPFVGSTDPNIPKFW